MISEAVLEKQEVAEPLGADELIAPGYKVVAHIRRGRSLDVYDVWSEERCCRCVAKVIRPDRLDDPKPRASLIDEGRLLERMTHPHIVRAYETIEGPSPAVILEAVSGATLEYIIEKSKRMPLPDVYLLGIHLCSAMAYLHRQGFLHLDLKPSNIVCERGVAKVIDLSIARRPGPGHAGIGTRPYMAPEQVKGEDLSAATDVWGIGAVLFEVTTGRRPFKGPDGDRFDQVERRADSVRSHRRVPRAFAQAVDACLDPDPSRRPSVQQLAHVLAQLVKAGRPVP
ncbi:MAG: serine/threonine protein kinase [Chloroflexi bacterium]|nr:serine/threonine protein kinase [Chloroflexota bacterium]